MRTISFLWFLFCGPVFLHAEERTASIHLTLRSRVQVFKNTYSWQEATTALAVPAHKSAIVICDMWDKHWCPSATKRCGVLAEKMAPVVKAARQRGVTIIHAPSECMNFYKDSPARVRMQKITRINLPKLIDLPDPVCPVDASDGGCDDNPAPNSYRAWSRQHELILIDEDRDAISDDGREIYALLKERGIDTLFVMGVHTNMCILHRSFAIKPMTRAGLHCVLVRDLTDAMYNPKSKPFVSHEEGTERIIQFIEQNWCPTCLSNDLLK